MYVVIVEFFSSQIAALEIEAKHKNPVKMSPKCSVPYIIIDLKLCLNQVVHHLCHLK